VNRAIPALVGRRRGEIPASSIAIVSARAFDEAHRPAGPSPQGSERPVVIRLTLMTGHVHHFGLSSRTGGDLPRPSFTRTRVLIRRGPPVRRDDAEPCSELRLPARRAPRSTAAARQQTSRRRIVPASDTDGLPARHLVLTAQDRPDAARDEAPPSGQGMNSVLHTTHRQNFLIPPRQHRSFTLAELLA
jgi:hypothetical protein